MKFEISNFNISEFIISKMSNFQNSNLQIFKLHGPTSILKYQKNVKLRQKQFHMKDMGKSSSRKLRYVIYYTLYRMDPQKTHQKISFSAKMSKIENWETKTLSPASPPPSPPHQPAARVDTGTKLEMCPPPGPNARRDEISPFRGTPHSDKLFIFYFSKFMIFNIFAQQLFFQCVF